MKICLLTFLSKDGEGEIMSCEKLYHLGINGVKALFKNQQNWNGTLVKPKKILRITNLWRLFVRQTHH